MHIAHFGRPKLALAAVTLSSLIFGLEISSIPVILPTLEQTLGADFVQLQWVMNAYTIAVATVLMAAGAFADRFGRKRVFLISTIAFGLASLICGLAPDTSVLIAGRFLQGVAGGVMLICQVAILSHGFQTGRARAVAFAWWGVIFGIGLGFGPIIGSAIVSVSSWEWVFLIHVILALVVVGLGLLGVSESRDPEAGRLDLAGMALLAIAVFALIYVITEGPRLGFSSPLALTTAAVAAASLIGFVIAERRASRPMFDLTAFRNPQFSGALLGAVGMNFSFWPLMIYLPIWFQAGLGYDHMGVGSALLAYTLPTLFMPPVAERLLLRFSPGVLIPAGLFIIGLGLALMAAGGLAPLPSWLTMFPGLVVAGVGLGLTNTPVTNTATGSVSSDRAGMASGMDMSARMITLSINIALMGAILFNGVLIRLRSERLAGDEQFLRTTAERIAAGNADAWRALPDGLAHDALVQGFSLITLYGALGCGALAVASALLFRRANPEVRQVE